MGIRKYLKDQVLIFDGAMGTMLQNKGLVLGELPEILNIKSPNLVIEIHKDYIDAGSNVITTNTFGANEKKLINSGFTVEEIIHHGVINAKEARGDKDVYIALDIGPIGELLEPMGTLTFEESYNIFKRQVQQGVKSGVDLIIIETMTDLYEAKAAILAAKENSDLPVFCTMSFEEDNRTFTGCNIDSMVMTLQGLEVDALGINCSLGPKEIEPILDKVLNIAKIPVIVQANAGLPNIVDGKTSFNLSPKEFAHYGARFVEKGVRVIGGCCGTTRKYIEDLAKLVKDAKLVDRYPRNISGVCTPTNAVIIDGVRVIGERINPTGKRMLEEALKKQDIDYILREAISQVEAGADILDINVGLPEIDQAKTMVKVVKGIQSIVDVPLQIDSTDPEVIENALRVYNGKAIVNSVNGDYEVLDRILPIVKKYGAAVIGLTLDEKGIPSSAVERFKIAKRIVERAGEYGIDKEDVYIDCLTLTVAAQQEDVLETIKSLSMVKEELNVKTVLGISNVSFGLPNRELINKTFLAGALYGGLDLPIIDPLDKDMMDTIRASNLLWNKDKDGKLYLSKYEESMGKDNINNKEETLDLFEIISRGMKDRARDATKSLLMEKKPLDIVNHYIVPALDEIGDKYEKGIIFLPQLIQAAETVKSAFEIIREELIKESGVELSKGKIILATVKGDIHDIGKNIVKVLLENYNYKIIDLGKDVSPEELLEEALKNDVSLIGLSALMTTTVKSMEESIAILKKAIPDIVIMVGGAVLNEEYAEMIKADYYARDARDAVSIAQKVLG